MCRIAMIALGLTLMTGCFPNATSPPMNKPSTISYNGESFLLATPVGDYEEYTDTVDPIDPSEHGRVTNAVLSNPAPMRVDDVYGFANTLGNLAFPGFGSGTLVVRNKADFGRCYGGYVNIPYTETFRFLIYEQQAEEFHLIVDCIHNRDPQVGFFDVSEHTATFFDSSGISFTANRTSR